MLINLKIKIFLRVHLNKSRYVTMVAQSVHAASAQTPASAFATRSMCHNVRAYKRMTVERNRL